jgi:ABC-type multidrug transport system fused ATPase/permease subunit
MIKKRYISIKDKPLTGIASKICFFIGFVLLIIFFIFSLLNQFTSYEFISNFVESGSNDIVLAIAILWIGAGFLLWFFNRQFSKLAEIAKELEQEDIEE